MHSRVSGAGLREQPVAHLRCNEETPAIAANRTAMRVRPPR